MGYEYIFFKLPFGDETSNLRLCVDWTRPMLEFLRESSLETKYKRMKNINKNQGP